MNKPSNLTNFDGEVRPLVAADFAQSQPAKAVLDPALYAGLIAMNHTARERKARGKQIAPTKVQAAIRFDADVLSGLRATGKGWQSRINALVREALAQGKLASR